MTSTIKKISLAVIYIESFFMVKSAVSDISFFTLLLFFSGILIYLGHLDFLRRYIDSYTHHDRIIYSVRKEVFIFLIFAISIVCIQPIMWNALPWLAENIDPPTYIFILFIPAVWLMKLKFTEIARISLLTLCMIPILLIAKYDSAAETFAIITYLLWFSLTIEAIFQRNKP